MYNIHLLPASFGDSILIEYGTSSKKYILIDGGPYFNFENVMNSIKRIAPNLKTLELLVITHIDIDHIDGTIMLLNQKELPFTIKEVWFNGLEEMTEADDLLGVLQGEYISVLIKAKKLAHNVAFKKKAVMVNDYNKLPVIKLAGGMTLTLLGPNAEGLKNMRAKWKEETDIIGNETIIKKRLAEDSRYEEKTGDDMLGGMSIEDMQKLDIKGDESEANGSSIAFIATYKNKSCLFTGDLFTEYLIQGIDAFIKSKEKLSVDAWKIAHHGSKKSTLDTLMKKVETKNILVSSDGKRYHHPDQETIAKLIKFNGPDLHFHFNYKTAYNKMWDNTALQKKYKYKTSYPNKEGIDGISIQL